MRYSRESRQIRTSSREPGNYKSDAAVFGPGVEDIFLLLHKARREVEVSAEMLLRSPYPEVRTQDDVDTWDSFRADVWPTYGSHSKHGDRVGLKLSGFKEGIERLCRPIVNRELKQKPKGVFRGIFGSFKRAS
jgi:hypothetical protein